MVPDMGAGFSQALLNGVSEFSTRAPGTHFLLRLHALAAAIALLSRSGLSVFLSSFCHVFLFPLAQSCLDGSFESYVSACNIQSSERLFQACPMEPNLPCFSLPPPQNSPHTFPSNHLFFGPMKSSEIAAGFFPSSEISLRVLFPLPERGCPARPSFSRRKVRTLAPPIGFPRGFPIAFFFSSWLFPCLRGAPSGPLFPHRLSPGVPPGLLLIWLFAAFFFSLKGVNEVSRFVL